MTQIRLVGLRDLAERLGIERRAFKRRLRALERDPALHGIPIIVEAEGKDWVKEHVLELLHVGELRTITARLDGHDGRLQSLEYRVDGLEAGQTGQ